MADKLRTLLAGVFFLAAVVLSLPGLGFGWWRWDFATGLLVMIAAFATLFLLGVWALWQVENLSWLATALPFVFGGLYTALPDIFPLTADDAAATTAGALFTFVLTLRRNPRAPSWVILPLLAAGMYALIGGAIPGPLDEILVDVLALLIAWLGARGGESARGQGARKRGSPPLRAFAPPSEGKTSTPREDELPHVPPFVEEE